MVLQVVLFCFVSFPDLGPVLHPCCLSATECKCLSGLAAPLAIVTATSTSLPALHA